MEITCQKCGATAAEGQAFCSKCGAVIGMADAGGGEDTSWNMAATMVGQKLPPSPPPPSRREAAPTITERPGFQAAPPAAPRPNAPPPSPPPQQPPTPQLPTPSAPAASGNKTLYVLLGLFALIAVGVVVLVILLLLLGS